MSLWKAYERLDMIKFWKTRPGIERLDMIKLGKTRPGIQGDTDLLALVAVWRQWPRWGTQEETQQAPALTPACSTSTGYALHLYYRK